MLVKKKRKREGFISACFKTCMNIITPCVEEKMWITLGETIEAASGTNSLKAGTVLCIQANLQILVVSWVYK